MTYNNTDQDPSSANRLIRWTVFDGDLVNSPLAITTLTVTAVNDAPVNHVPGGQSTDEDANLVFSSGNGNQISITDGDGSTIQVTLSAANGSLTLTTTAGVSFSFSDANGIGAGDGSADATMTFRGTLAAGQRRPRHTRLSPRRRLLRR